jgi:hypothetical protein
MNRDLRDVVNILLSYAGFPDPYTTEKMRASFDRETAARLDYGLARSR